MFKIVPYFRFICMILERKRKHYEMETNDSGDMMAVESGPNYIKCKSKHLDKCFIIIAY